MQMSLFQEMSTSATSVTSAPAISTDTRSVISSPGSGAGPTPCAWPDGLTLERCGLDLALANLSLLPESEPASRTNATSGPTFTGSSASAALQSSLESRLRVRLECSGSMLFSLTWKTRTTPSGRPICARRAVGLRTSDKDSSGWGTPTAQDCKHGTLSPSEMTRDPNNLRSQVYKAAIQSSPWATPAARDYHSESATDAFNEKRWRHPRGKPLSAQATLSTWVSPQAADANGSGLNQHTASLCRQTRQVSMWPTPTASLANKGVRSFDGGIREAMRSRGPDLAAVSCLASWATPVATELGNTLENYRAMKANMKSGPRSAITHPSLQAQLATLQTRASGPSATGLPAKTENRGQLNPAHSRWLMGYPAEWDSCGATAMQLFRRSRRNSSQHTSTSNDGSMD